jgi:uncharacterized protein (TIGR00369 family)
LTDRSRTYTWSDPSRNAEAGLAMAGIDFLRAMMDGSLPLPAFQATLDYVLIEVEEGRVVFEGRPAEYLLNPLGAVHGGYYAGMLDSALGYAIHSRLAAHQGYTTLEFKLNLVRALPIDGRAIRAIGQVVHPGRKIATSEARLEDESGKLYAHATCSCLIFSTQPDE